jgi:predicted enzyme related to lactoylglutathione lyase
MLLSSLALLSVVCTPATQENVLAAAAREIPRVLGFELPCGDVERAVGFYERVLGFEAVRRETSGAVMRKGEVLLVLDAQREPTASGSTEDSVSAYVNYRVADIATAAASIEEHGGSLADPEPSRFVLGHSLTFRDSEGNLAQIVRLDSESEPDTNLPLIFNLSIRAPRIEDLEGFFCADMGLEVYSRDYLPMTLPLKRSGALSLVLHAKPALGTGEPESSAAGTRILFAAPAQGGAPVEAGYEGALPLDSLLFGAAALRHGPAHVEVIFVLEESLGASVGDETR